ncbi:unnamed protein product [Notodromas monacha]|uniref:Uncharacterized protein n=1 Tax=Notodromas monacha TaxID=399045 RepID=A0A7R9BNM6_9CRUS|nr:unnamed protein product [Notodromas monacha]CAG0917461.1 unnamed protein product [Notodromas monacha]
MRGSDTCLTPGGNNLAGVMLFEDSSRFSSDSAIMVATTQEEDPEVISPATAFFSEVSRISPTPKKKNHPRDFILSRS